MGSSLAEQLSAALKASQERANKGTPERAALDILTSQIDILVEQVRKSEAQQLEQPPPTAEAVPQSGWKSPVPPGYKLIPSRATPLVLWFMKAKVGDTFIVSMSGRSAGYHSQIYRMAKEHGKIATAEQCVVVHGSTSEPQATPAVLVTLTGLLDAKSIHDSGSPDGRANGGSPEGV